MSKTVTMLVLLFVGAQVNLSALVPAAPGQAPPPWWTGGGLLWPFFADTHTLLPAGGLRDSLTPVLGIMAAACLLMAAAALWGWMIPAAWFPALVIAGAAASVVLQVMWLSGWAVLPLLVDAALLWAVMASGATVASLRG